MKIVAVERARPHRWDLSWPDGDETSAPMVVDAMGAVRARGGDPYVDVEWKPRTKVGRALVNLATGRGDASPRWARS
jgi:hypothetical protein